MKKLLAALLVPVFLVPFPTVTTDQETSLLPEDQHQLRHGEATLLEHATIPANPRLYRDTLAYGTADFRDMAELLPADAPLSIVSLERNADLQAVFKLSSGHFIPANQLVVFDDQERSRAPHQDQFWLADEAIVYDQPHVLGTKTVKTDLKPYQAIQTSQVAETYDGLYYLVEGKGWLEARHLLTAEERMAQVQKLLDDKYNKDKLSIYVMDLTDGLTAQSRADQVMYGASVTKLAILYEAQQQLTSGQIKLEDTLTYTEAVNDYDGAYDTAGSGAISKKADDKDYKVEDLLKALAQSSDNAASNILGYYLTEQNSPSFQAKLQDLLGQEWDMIERDISAHQAAQMMAAIYAQGGVILDYLSETDFDETRIAKDLPVKVAHKTGDAYDFKHDVAIVYADQPFILSIFSDKASYDDLSAIAKDIYRILKG